MVDHRALSSALEALEAPRRSAIEAGRHGGDLEWDWIFSPQEWAAGHSILVCCLSCHRTEPDDLSTPGDPHALVAPFARRNYYRIAARMMGEVARGIEGSLGIPRRSLRIFCNSRIPEKPLLAASGLAMIGRNSLAIVPGLGSLFVIAGAVIPRALPEISPDGPALRDPCGSCMKCIDACPVGAISAAGIVDADQCLQGLAAAPAVLTPRLMETWGNRLYGCQECQSVCPWNRRIVDPCEAVPAKDSPGPSVSLRTMLSRDPSEIAGLFRGTAMGMSWISKEALLRNALVAAGNSGERALEPLLKAHVESGTPAVREAALWALEKLRGA
ncbi:MAG TPA: 4Fe-4S double cluster binding domain-containing protein [Spirochaetia bacterium]|nr:4Fe-4S double cluster binding domain-containing protein [Spirochaetia bacterium]